MTALDGTRLKYIGASFLMGVRKSKTIANNQTIPKMDIRKLN